MKPVRRALLNVIAPRYVLPKPLRRWVLNIAGLRIGKRTRVCSGCLFAGESQVVFGDDCFVNHDCFFDAAAPISVGDRTFLASRVTLVTSTHDVGTTEMRAGTWITQEIKVGSGCWLGAGATVLPGVTIGNGCVIGAGSVVTRDCEPDGLYVGVPARRVRDLP